MSWDQKQEVVPTCKKSPSLMRMILALWMADTRSRLLVVAYSKAYSATRMLAARVMILRLSTTPGMTCTEGAVRLSE